MATITWKQLSPPSGTGAAAFANIAARGFNNAGTQLQQALGGAADNIANKKTNEAIAGLNALAATGSQEDVQARNDFIANLGSGLNLGAVNEANVARTALGLDALRRGEDVSFRNQEQVNNLERDLLTKKYRAESAAATQAHRANILAEQQKQRRFQERLEEGKSAKEGRGNAAAEFIYDFTKGSSEQFTRDQIIAQVRKKGFKFTDLNKGYNILYGSATGAGAANKTKTALAKEDRAFTRKQITDLSKNLAILEAGDPKTKKLDPEIIKSLSEQLDQNRHFFWSSQAEQNKQKTQVKSLLRRGVPPRTISNLIEKTSGPFAGNPVKDEYDSGKLTLEEESRLLRVGEMKEKIEALTNSLNPNRRK